MNIIDQLKQPLDPKRVCKRDGAGKQKLSYLETHDVIGHLNHIFGFDGWESSITRMTAYPENAPTTCFVATVSITVHFGDKRISREGTGFGTVRSGGYELGAKEAESDALKRCARFLGDQFGNSLYEKDAPEHSGQARAAIATSAQLAECEKLRQAATEMGLKGGKSGKPLAPMPADAPASDVEAMIDRLNGWIAKNQPATEPESGESGAGAPAMAPRLEARLSTLNRDGNGDAVSDFMRACDGAQISYAVESDIVAIEAACSRFFETEQSLSDWSFQDFIETAEIINAGKLELGA